MANGVFDKNDPQLIHDYLAGVKSQADLARERGVTPAAIAQWATKKREKDPNFVRSALSKELNRASLEASMIYSHAADEVEKVPFGDGSNHAESFVGDGEFSKIFDEQVNKNAMRILVHRGYVDSLLSTQMAMRNKLVSAVDLLDEESNFYASSLSKMVNSLSSLVSSVKVLIDMDRTAHGLKDEAEEDKSNGKLTVVIQKFAEDLDQADHTSK